MIIKKACKDSHCLLPLVISSHSQRVQSNRHILHFVVEILTAAHVFQYRPEPFVKETVEEEISGKSDCLHSIGVDDENPVVCAVYITLPKQSREDG